MTRQITSRSGREPQSTALLRPVRPSRNLTGEVMERIAGEIRSGRLSPGDRLPTEVELMTAMGVSRTVVREAVAALRAEGLVMTRQGLGAFVAADASRVSFRIATENPAATGAIGDVLSVMELRLAVEVEAAALAAERASEAQMRCIDAALAAIGRAIAAGQTAVAEDFAFHRSIADATGNMHFAEFLMFLGRHVIPRQTIRAAHGSPAEQRAYLVRIQTDHARIAAAIRDRDAGEARRVMRLHLTKSLAKYHKLAQALRSGGPVAGAG